MLAHSERLAPGDLLHLTLCNLFNRQHLLGELLTVEGGQQQLAVAHVLGLVKQQHRVAAERGLKNLVAFAGVQYV